MEIVSVFIYFGFIRKNEQFLVLLQKLKLSYVLYIDLFEFFADHFANQDFRKFLRQSETVDALYDLLKEADANALAG